MNEEGPQEWFRCICVVDETKSWGVQAYCVMPNPRGRPSGDAYNRFYWNEFDALGVKSKFVAVMDLGVTDN